MLSYTVDQSCSREYLAWRTCMDDIEPIQRKGHRVRLNELERIMRLRRDVHPYNLIEAGPVVAHCGPACAAEQVKQSHKPSSFALPTPFPIRIVSNQSGFGGWRRAAPAMTEALRVRGSISISPQPSGSSAGSVIPAGLAK